MKKRVLSILLSAAMVTMLVAGCGSSSDESESSSSGDGEQKTLEVWVPPLDEDTEGNWGELLTDWEEENNCKVNITLVPWGAYEETWTTALNSGEGPDVGYMYYEMFPTFIDSGAVVDMSDYVTEEDEAEYKYLSNGYIMGGQYGWPLVTGVPFVIYYNQDILDSLGESAPETWDDFTRICEEATLDTDGDGEIDQYGFAAGFNVGDGTAMGLLNAYYYWALWQNGGQVFSDDLKSVVFTDEKGTEAVEWLQSLTQYMNPDYMAQTQSDSFTNIFAEGKAAFGIRRSSQTDGTTFAEEYPDLNWDFVTSLYKEDYGTFGATDSLTLMSACEDPDLAMNFIKYVTGAEFMEQYHAKCPGAALTESEPYVGDEKMAKLYNEDKDKWHGLQVGPCGVEIYTQLGADLQGILSGEMTVEEGLKEAEDYANGLLDEYWADRE